MSAYSIWVMEYAYVVKQPTSLFIYGAHNQGHRKMPQPTATRRLLLATAQPVLHCAHTFALALAMPSEGGAP